MMLKQVVEAIKQILFLTQQTEKNREEIKELRLENKLLKFERQLPSGNENKDESSFQYQP
jgi:hypothetical protein